MSNPDDKHLNNSQNNKNNNMVEEKRIEINDKDRKNLQKLLKMIDKLLNTLEDVDPKVLKNNPIAKKSIIRYIAKIYHQYLKLGDKLGPVLGDLLETKVHEFLFEVTKPHTEITPEYLYETACEIFPLVAHRLEFVLEKSEGTRSNFEEKIQKIKDLEESISKQKDFYNERTNAKDNSTDSNDQNKDDDLKYAERESNEDNFDDLEENGTDADN